MRDFQKKISSEKSCHTCPPMSRTHGESFLKTSLQASTVHMQAVAIARHMLGIYNTFSPSPSFLLFDRGTDRQEHTRPHAHCSPHTWFIQHRYGRIKDSNINGERLGENAKASHTNSHTYTDKQMCKATYPP